jgi:threonine dehydratase
VLTPLGPAPEALRAGRALFLKREDLHALGAFKWRGAFPTLQAYRERGAAGVVTASTGNHGAATAWAAARLGLHATVFAPVAASRAKLALIEAQGAQIQLMGRDFDETKEAARTFAGQEGVPFFEDGAEPAQYEGYGAIAREILEQCTTRPAAVIVPVGNGALIGGIGLVLQAESPETRVIGVAAKEAPVMALSFQAHRPVLCDRVATFADGLAVRIAVPHAVAVLNRVVDDFVLVSEREIARALAAFAAAGIRVEGAAAAGLAALPKVPPLSGPLGPTVLIVTGRNIDEELWRHAVAEPEGFSD